MRSARDVRFCNIVCSKLERRLKERSRYLVLVNVELGKKPWANWWIELWDKLSISM